MILETIGLPGSGKSYLCDEIEKQFNTNVINIPKITSNKILFKIIKHIFILLSNKTSFARKVRNEIYLVLKKEELQSNFNIYDDEVYSVNMICCLIILYRLLEKSKKIYIFDEGIIHTLIKMSADFKLSHEAFDSIINIIERKVYYKRWCIIYNHIDVETCLLSIKKRDRHVCTFDDLSDSDLKLILKYYNEYNRIYCNTRNVVIVEREQSMSEKMKKIFDKINEIGVR